MIASPKKPLVAVVATGGTIASKRNADGSSQPSLDGGSLLGLLPEAGIDLMAIDLMAKDSSSLTLADMQSVSNAIEKLLLDETIDGIVVLHGTDAMEETAILVQLQQTLTKPVIFTGAQYTADHPEADGPANLAAAVTAAIDANNTERGVLVCFGGRTCPAFGLYKHSADNVDAFRQSVEQENPRQRLPGNVSALRVDIIAIYPGCDGALLEASINAGARGIVLAALGSGNANPLVVEAVHRCSARNIPVVVSSRVPQGKLTPSYGGGGGGHDLAHAGAVHSTSLRAGQARILLAALLASGASSQSIRDAFSAN